MTRFLPVLFACALAAPAAAQNPAPQPAPQPSVQPAAPAAAPDRKPLILDLDENSRRQILSGTRANEGTSRGDALPSLGDDARKIDPAALRGDPFPKGAAEGSLTPF